MKQQHKRAQRKLHNASVVVVVVVVVVAAVMAGCIVNSISKTVMTHLRPLVHCWRAAQSVDGERPPLVRSLWWWSLVTSD